MAGILSKIFGSQRMLDTFAHIGVAYQQDTGRGIDQLLDVMGLTPTERRELIIDFDEKFGASIASGNTLLRAYAIQQAIDELMNLLFAKRPDFAEALR